MLQNNSLPSNEQIAFQLCINRMAGGSFGTLATFPLYCVGQLTRPSFPRWWTRSINCGGRY